MRSKARYPKEAFRNVRVNKMLSYFLCLIVDRDTSKIDKMNKKEFWVTYEVLDNV